MDSEIGRDILQKNIKSCETKVRTNWIMYKLMLSKRNKILKVKTPLQREYFQTVHIW